MCIFTCVFPVYLKTIELINKQEEEVQRGLSYVYFVLKSIPKVDLSYFFQLLKKESLNELNVLSIIAVNRLTLFTSTRKINGKENEIFNCVEYLLSGY